MTDTGRALSQSHVEGREGRKAFANPGGRGVSQPLAIKLGLRQRVRLSVQRQKERLGSLKPQEVFKASVPSYPAQPPPLRVQKGTYQDVQAGGLQQGDLVRDGQAGEAWQTFSKLYDLNNALGGQFTEFVPEPQVQSDSMVSTGILRGRINTVRGSFWEAQQKAQNSTCFLLML